MSHQEKRPPISRPKLNLVWLIFLPGLIVFDFFYYWINRSSCLECSNVTEFIRNSSLSFFIVVQLYQTLRKKSNPD
ncbi:hypothetical protein M1523_02585 [Patescibacteria group bacterium]|nr:hypothetical protein [Patescibacteria group bacterium]MCL5091392.1 hypothetical protein [Patescibacteria group bacterium]